MASFLSQASTYFGRTNISTNYTIDESQQPAHCGLWKIYKASRNASSSNAGPANAGRQNVSVWVHTFNTKGQTKGRVVEQLKKEASSLTRLRHPCILEVVEPLEETRSEISFATEQVVAPLQEALVADHRSDVQLDEVEIQKGLLQVARGLEFLHGAKMVHQNLTTESVLINVKGDWKIAGFSFLTPLTGPDGSATPWSFPDYDPSLPPALSRNFDYMAPEYALDEKLLPENDLYSLGCIVFAVHNKGSPPFRNRNNLTNLRSNADQLSTVQSSPSWQRMGRDVLDLLSSLLTRFPGGRPSASAFQHSSYFNSILVSTLKFMERENFAGRTKEERVQYLKGLLKILPQFSDRLLRRKVLPAVLELMTDRSLLPFILPNVFHISKSLSSIEFTNTVLPKLQPLFSVQDPPQNMLLLLDQIELFVQKTSPSVFREGVTPLLYSSLEAENVMVQEKALQTVPRLAEILEYAHVKEVLFPKLAALFAKTKVLSVKVNTLICFHSMVSILDKYTLTEKLVPILARIKTREPSVMIATLAVYEAMSKKVDRETLATSIIPQLWTMSVGPLLNAEQFSRFMKAVKEMGERVEKEHTAHLREVRRMQEHTDSYVSAQGGGGGGGLGGGVTGIGAGGEIDFATLVGSAKRQGGEDQEVTRDLSVAAASRDPFGFEDPPPTSSNVSSTASPSQNGGSPSSILTPSHTGTKAWNNSNSFPTAGVLKTSTQPSNFPSAPTTSSTLPQPSSSNPPPNSSPFLANLSKTTKPSWLPPPPGWNATTSSSPLHPGPTTMGPSVGIQSNTAAPNYNIHLPSAEGWAPSAFGGPNSSSIAKSTTMAAIKPTTPFNLGQSNNQTAQRAPTTTLLQPTPRTNSGLQATKPSGNNSNLDWKDFDPLG
ncbi:kinase-like protein [Violaceomyces palustris]|uniref:Kinase-like protein n=1 Tax=Violaceomyces palustris TaxID=1673888 RepID=A0ACD0NY99_9BASI|nr:kinase-like protein [Violaceomyces palustris]